MQFVSQQASPPSRIAAAHSGPCDRARHAAIEITRRFVLSKLALDRKPVGAVVLRKSFQVSEAGRLTSTSVQTMDAALNAVMAFAESCGLDDLAAELLPLDLYGCLGRRAVTLPGLQLALFKGWCEFRFESEPGNKLLAFVEKHRGQFLLDHY
ncbi:hypothetical protein [Cupriavidus sp. UME77]|uniref:hypothetical protein n=1 Tax=Cupriavidus sp. UME77 TaxID=1862321 RepID=UPI001602F7C0|nr:hypothetical protein [Cupriavidus sp. UME77]